MLFRSNIDNLDLLESAIITVSEQNVEKLSAINFELKDFEKEKMKIFELALVKAKEKAMLAKDKLDIERINVVYVNEVKNEFERYIAYEANKVMYQRSSLGDVNTVPSFYAEKIKLRSKIEVYYEITF